MKMKNCNTHSIINKLLKEQKWTNILMT
jgi:hypothetical protein